MVATTEGSLLETNDGRLDTTPNWPSKALSKLPTLGPDGWRPDRDFQVPRFVLKRTEIRRMPVQIREPQGGGQLT